MKNLTVLLICCSLFLIPYHQVFAQTEAEGLGRDVFELTPEKMRLFGGAADNKQLNSLFNGDNMQQNGLFTTSPRQLGGATPLTYPIRDNQEEVKSGPTRVVITSRYAPEGDLTKDSKITLTVTLKNIGESATENIKFYARLEDNNLVLLDNPPADPPYDAGSKIEDKNIGLIWTKLKNGSPITIKPGESVTISWSFQPSKDDTILRWRLVAEYGAGESILRQWIPVKNPNPTGVLVPGNPANGIPVSCTTSGANQSQPFPQGSSPDQVISAMQSRWKFQFKDGSYSWRDPQFLPVLKVWWDTLSAVECTPYLTEVNNKNNGSLEIYAHDIGVLWGTYGLDFNMALAINVRNHLQAINNGIPEKVTQNIIHELGHAYNNDRGSNPAYWVKHNEIYNSAGPISGYGASSITENFADVVGYYVGRCAGESFGTSGPNPFASGHTEFYNFAKSMIFGNVEFGPPAPSEVSC